MDTTHTCTPQKHTRRRTFSIYCIYHNNVPLVRRYDFETEPSVYVVLHTHSAQQHVTRGDRGCILERKRVRAWEKWVKGASEKKTKERKIEEIMSHTAQQHAARGGRLVVSRKYNLLFHVCSTWAVHWRLQKIDGSSLCACCCSSWTSILVINTITCGAGGVRV